MSWRYDGKGDGDGMPPEAEKRWTDNWGIQSGLNDRAPVIGMDNDGAGIDDGLCRFHH